MAALPSPDAFAVLANWTCGFSLVRWRSLVGNSRSPLLERARLGDGLICEVRWTPDALAALDELDQPPPAPPGQPPFSAGETLTYHVYWDGGPHDVAAGIATLVVLEGSEGATRWVFEARAETADWVSTFFQARDRFVTVTDAELLPTQHRREIREGRREVDRRYIYDRDARIVQTDQMALSLGDAAARDALSALYYVRTLPLIPGAMLSLPLNDAGTPLMLQVPVGEVESIEQGDRAVPALRIEPRAMRRIERRRPMVMTLWLSADARRVPLRAIIDAGFGVIRLELQH